MNKKRSEELEIEPFDAKVWASSSSYVVTVPKFNIKAKKVIPGKKYRCTMELIEEKKEVDDNE